MSAAKHVEFSLQYMWSLHSLRIKELHLDRCTYKTHLLFSAPNTCTTKALANESTKQ
eukprot:c36338_g1_i1 orf=107-277(+)